MPMAWGPEAETRLLMAIFKQVRDKHVKLDMHEIAAYVGPGKKTATEKTQPGPRRGKKRKRDEVQEEVIVSSADNESSDQGDVGVQVVIPESPKSTKVMRDVKDEQSEVKKEPKVKEEPIAKKLHQVKIHGDEEA
ncbi:hypothetical protein N7532_006071 [Penicillium argentinense]|uniref:Uncharacterized protein n=1 Tax=Penicillium argentinense TaxID=1131581 RepID=A0A9W9FFE0_9EURO|nr:uncharacterized protein N7532_006071 [Penicillium argentinense]KAJ5099070.1 hypothetical protein N7532_006071 [Penicillium argentinense]